MARVLITGSSRGIGRATAIALAERGHEVIATARDVSALGDLPVARRLALDVTDEASVAEAAALAGDVDVLVNNAGDLFLAPIESSPIAAAKELFDLNVFGALRMIQAFVPGMRRRGSGSVVNVSSFVGRFSMPLSGVYSSSKFALEAMSESLRFELRPFGVRVVLVEPGAVSTGALASPRAYFSERDPYLPLAAQLRLDPWRMSRPKDVADTIAKVLETNDPPLRWRVGRDAEAMLDARARLDDAAFEETLRSVRNVRW